MRKFLRFICVRRRVAAGCLIAAFNIQVTNLFPLLHVTIARGKFIQSHNYFCGQEEANYFDYVGEQIADILLKNKNRLRVWI